MATRFIEEVDPTSDNSITTIVTALKNAVVGAVPFVFDKDTGLAHYYDRVNSALRTLITTDGTETLTNKSLTSPTVASPTITGVLTSTAVQAGPAPVAFASGTTLSLTAALHAGKVVYVTDVAADYRLPAATGTGNKYTIVLGATQTGASTIKVNAAPGTDTMIGNAVLMHDGGDTTFTAAAGATADTIDLLGTSNSTGGMLGGLYEFIDVASGLWHVNLISDAGGTEATPFSATVP